MPVPTTNVKFSDIQTEFGGSNPISLSEYYRGGSNVPSSQADIGYGLISTSGAISVGPFRGATKRTYAAMNGFNWNGVVQDGVTEAYVNMVVNTNGIINMTYNTGNGNPSWTTPSTSGIGSTHWIRVDIASSTGAGTFTGTTGTWLQVNVARTFRYAYTGLVNAVTYQRRVRLRIATDSSGSNVVADGTSNWNLSRQ